jgi:dTDP-4-dehydrorhamnose 3,5-epimerase
MKLIDGVKTKELRVIPDERGRLMEILRVDDEIYDKFGQVYMTTNYPGVVKAWHYHKKQTDYVTCVKGMIKVVLYDARDDSPTKGEFNEFFVGEHNPVLVKIPVGVYHGWKCVSPEESIAVSVPDVPYNYENPDEFREPYDSKKIDYDWDRQMG